MKSNNAVCTDLFFISDLVCTAFKSLGTTAKNYKTINSTTKFSLVILYKNQKKVAVISIKTV